MLIDSDFKPAWWLKNSHLQTLYPPLLRTISSPLNVKRERLDTADHDFIDIDWCGQGDKPIVILLHGLTGSSQSSYIAGLQHVLLQHGLRSVTLNFRGCSGEMNQLARSYHSGETADLDFLYRTLRQREPETALAAVGFSLGGNVLLKWLGEKGSRISINAAVAVSVPFQLSKCATKLDRGFSKIYRNNLIRELKQFIEKKHHHLEASGNLDEARKIRQLGNLTEIRSFWQYDDQVVARLHGFKNAQHYYQQSSSRQYLHKIRISTLLIQARDDPFMDCSVIPGVEELSASIDLEVTPAGGHVGFIGGNTPFKPEFWLEQRIPEFLYHHGV